MFKKFIFSPLILIALQATAAVSLQPCDGGAPVEFSEVQLAQLQSQLINGWREEYASMIDWSKASIHAIKSHKLWKNDESRTKAIERLEGLKNFSAKLETQNEAAIPVVIRRNTLELIRNLLFDAASSDQAPTFNIENAHQILGKCSVKRFLPLLYALAFLNTTNEVLLQTVARHYLAIQKNIGFDDFVQHVKYIAAFFQPNCVKTLLAQAATSYTCSQTFTGHDNWVMSVAFSPDEKTLASGSNDNTIKLWKLVNGQWQCIQTLSEHDNWVWSVAFSPDGQTLASGSDDNTIKLWKLVNDQWQCTQTLTGHGGWVRSVTFSPDGQTLASGSADHTTKLWKLVNGQWQCIQTLTGHRDWVWSVAFSPDGQTLASGSGDYTIKLWKLVNGQWQCIQTLTGHTGWVYSVAFSPDGKTLASGSNDHAVKLWKLVDGQWQCTQTLTEHKYSVVSVAFLPDGTKLATGSGDYTVKLWDVHTGQCIQTLTGHTGWVYSVAFSPDGTKLATGSRDNTAKLWVINLNEWQHVLLVWAMNNPGRLRLEISPFLDEIYASLPERLQQKIIIKTPTRKRKRSQISNS